MKIKSLRVKNFLSIGDEPLEIDFEKFGNIVVIKGQNLDVGDHEDAADSEHFSNGSGKSTIAECVSYALYGKCIRNKVSHGEVLNAINKKKLEVEICFSKNGIDYKVVRKRKPDIHQLFQDDLDVTLGAGTTVIQKKIDAIVGMNHKAFVNMVCFGQHNSYNFLDCELAEQRSIIESILSLEIYKDYSETAKNELKFLKQSLKENIVSYEKMKDNESACESRIRQVETKQHEWLNLCETQIADYKNTVSLWEQKLTNTSVGTAIVAYEKAQEEIGKIKNTLPDMQSSKEDIVGSLNPARQRYDSLRIKKHEVVLEIKSLSSKIDDEKDTIEKCEKEIEQMRHLNVGTRCDKCFSKIDPQNYKHVIPLKENNIESSKAKIEEFKKIIDLKSKEVSGYNANVDKLNMLIESANKKVAMIDAEIVNQQSRMNSLSAIKLPDSSSDQIVMTEKMNVAKSRLIEKIEELNNGGPYKEILADSKSELIAVKSKCETCKASIDETEKLIPYYDFWVKGFSDEGIRSFIIQGIIPALNSRISYWLQFLINGKLKVSFDKELNAMIERNPSNGDPFVYSATCGGERRRIDLAISQAFAHILTLSSGTRPSLVFLDEVATNIDKRGLGGIFKMICELASDKQVFVITHDQTLNDMLDGADVITMRKKDGFSVRVENDKTA